MQQRGSQLEKRQAWNKKGEKPSHTEGVMAKCKVHSQMIACGVPSEAGVTYTTQMTT